MNAQVVQLRPAPRQARALEVPAVIAPSVNLMRFSEALALAGLVGRHDASRGVLVIQPAVVPPARCLECGGTGFDEDARCDVCDGTGHEGSAGHLSVADRPRVRRLPLGRRFAFSGRVAQPAGASDGFPPHIDSDRR